MFLPKFRGHFKAAKKIPQKALWISNLFFFSEHFFSGSVWTPSLPPSLPPHLKNRRRRLRPTMYGMYPLVVPTRGRVGFMLSVQWMTALLARVVEDERGPYLFPTPPPPPLAAHYMMFYGRPSLLLLLVRKDLCFRQWQRTSNSPIKHALLEDWGIKRNLSLLPTR